MTEKTDFLLEVRFLRDSERNAFFAAKMQRSSASKRGFHVRCGSTSRSSVDFPVRLCYALGEVHFTRRNATLNGKIVIDPKLYDVYPDIRLGCLHFSATVTAPDQAFWAYMEKTVLPAVRERIAGKQWSEISGVRGSRAAYKAFGRNPGRYRVSSEALLRRVRRGDALYQINSVVDVNNLISVESGLSAGSYDLSKLQGVITLREAQAGEGYEGIGKGFLDLEHLLVLADDLGVFGSSLSDSNRGMVTEESCEILVVVYCFEGDINLDALLEQAKTAFERYADAKDVTVWSV